MKSIRISEETYRKLCERAGRLQAELKRPVSIDEAIRSLLEGPKIPSTITDLAGTLELSDEEVLEIKREIREAWKKWKLPRSV
jgi:predicted CopG family antitoxin